MLMRKKSKERMLKSLNIVMLGVFLLQPISSPGLLYAVAANTNDVDNSSQTVIEQDSQEQSNEVKEAIEEDDNVNENAEVTDNDDKNEKVDDTSDVVSEDETEDGVDVENDEAEMLDENNAEVKNEEEITVIDEGEKVDNIEKLDENVEEDVMIENAEEVVEEKKSEYKKVDDDKDKVDDDDDDDVIVEKAECTDKWIEKSDAYTRCVEESIEYVLDFDNDKKTTDDVVKITFTKIDKDANKDNKKQVTIKKVKLTDEQVKQLGVISNIAYDITSTMEKSSFKYNLILPLPKDADIDKGDSTVIYVEDEKNFKDSKDVKKDKGVRVNVDNEKHEIAVKGMGHFTIFVVKGAVPSVTQKCEKPSVKNNDTGKKFCTIQEAIDDKKTKNGDKITIGEGEYIEEVSVTKAVSLNCEKGAVLNGDKISTDNNPKTAFIIDSNKVMIKGCEIEGYRRGIRNGKMKGYADITIKDNYIHNLKPHSSKVFAIGDYSAIAIAFGKNTGTMMVDADTGIYDKGSKKISAENDLDKRLNYRGLKIIGNEILGKNDIYGGIVLSAITGKKSEHIKLKKNIIMSVKASAIVLDSVAGVDVGGNTLENSMLSGIFISSSEGNDGKLGGGYDMWEIGNDDEFGPKGIIIADDNTIVNNGHADKRDWLDWARRGNNGVSVLSNPDEIEIHNNKISLNSPLSSSSVDRGLGNGVANLLPNIKDGQVNALNNYWGDPDLKGPRDIWSGDGSVLDTNPDSEEGDYAFGNVLYFKQQLPKLVAEYKFDDCSGTTVKDSVGNHDGTVENSAEWTEGVSEQGMSFDGESSYVAVSNGGVNLGTTHTVSTWINVADFSDPHKNVVFGEEYAKYALWFRNGKQMTYNAGAGSASSFYQFTLADTLQENTWYHLVITRNKGDVKVFINGDLKGTGTLSGSADNPLTIKYIGKKRVASTGEFPFDGRLDEVRFYDGALSDKEVTKLYESYKNSTPSSCSSEVTLCKTDVKNNPLSGWQLQLLGDKIETLSVATQKNGGAPDMVSSMNLPQDNYVAVANGTYEYRGNTGLLADANFSQRLENDKIAHFKAGTQFPYWNWANDKDFKSGWEGYLGVMVNGTPTNWSDALASDHRYALEYENYSGVLTFQEKDSAYGDNKGNLKIDIYKGYAGTTGENGCVTFENVPTGDYLIQETLQEDWKNISGLKDVSVALGSKNRFTIVNQKTDESQECIVGAETFVNGVLSNNQGLRGDGGVVANVRSDASKVLGAPDGEASGTFYSLGKNGTITTKFEYPVANVAGNDLSFYEITWGNRQAYMLEKAKVEVSQDGTTWQAIGEVNNHDSNGVGKLDFDSTGWSWIQYVRLTETTSLAGTNGDGYDLDAISAKSALCEDQKMEAVCGDGIKNNTEQCDGVDGVGEGEFCTKQCKLVPFYEQTQSECGDNETPVLITEKTLDSYDRANQVDFSLDGGKKYLVQTAGTYIFNNRHFVEGTNRYKYQADAAYHTGNGWATSGGTAVANANSGGVHSVLGDLGRGMGIVDWGSNPNVNSEDENDHVYTRLVTPSSDEDVTFLISDWYSDWYGSSCDNQKQACFNDNTGELKVSLYECRANKVTVNTQKIVCTNESDLPNMMETSNENLEITADTARNWANNHESCHLEKNWKFNWTKSNGGSGVIDTAVNNTVEIPYDSQTDRIFMREIEQPNYIPFTYHLNGRTDVDDVTAEFYCTGDSLHYDNSEHLRNLAPGKKYYCVAWNVPANGSVSGMKWEDKNMNGRMNRNESGLNDWTIVTGQYEKIGQYDVDAKGAEVSLGNFDNDQYYVLKVNGTFGVGDYITADAECSTRKNSPWNTIVKNYESHGEQLLDLEINKNKTEWGTCSPNHTYTKLIKGDGSEVKLSIRDIYPSNNTGTLNVTVYKLNNSLSTVTANGGEYEFANLMPGEYMVCEMHQENWLQTSPQSSENGGCHTFTITGDNTVVKNQNFGNVLSSLGVIRGRKYRDVNGNGDFDSAEKKGKNRLNDWKITLFDTNWEEISSMMTGDDGTSVGDVAQGQYRFENLPVGQYYVCEESREGWLQTEPTMETGVEHNGQYCHKLIINKPGEKVGEVQFGNFEGGIIQGRKYIDGNTDGLHQKEEEKLNGWHIRLYKDNDMLDGVKTQEGILPSWMRVGEAITGDNEDSNYQEVGEGQYRFGPLMPGDYYVCEVNQTGYTQTGPLLGANSVNFDGVSRGGGLAVANYSGQEDEGQICWQTIIKKSGQKNTWHKFGNINRGKITVTKWNDLNGDGQFDESEEVMNGWEMNLTPMVRKKIIADDVEKTIVDDGTLSQETETDGSTTFDVERGGYWLRETLQPGWQQTNMYCGYDDIDVDMTSERSLITENEESLVKVIEDENSIPVKVVSGKELHCYVGNQPIESKLFISKTNDGWSNGVKKSGDLVTYTIKVRVDQNKIQKVKVADLPPKNLTYVAGSWKAISNKRGDLANIAGLGLTHIYASPGEWSLGDMAQDEVITLTYQARVNEGASNGLHKDLVWGNGVDMRGDNLLALTEKSDFDINGGVINDEFAGTQIIIANDDNPESVTVKADKEEIVKKKKVIVKGTSTFLPRTGADGIWLLIAGAMLVLGLILLGISQKKKIKNIFGLVILMGLMAGIGQVNAATVVRIDEPEANINGAFRIGFVAMDTDKNNVIVECWKKGPKDLNFTKFQEINLIAGGSSGECTVDTGKLTDEGEYSFKISLNGIESDVVKTSFKGIKPGEPKYIEKKKEYSCSNELEVKTANDGRTVYVEIYRAKSKTVTVNNSSKIKTITVGPNQKIRFNDDLSGVGCKGNYYYATRAFDDHGNYSPVREEKYEVKVTKKVKVTKATSTEITPTIGTTTAGGGIAVASETSGTTVEQQQSSEQQAKEETDKASEENGIQANEEGPRVLGASTSSRFVGTLKDWRFWLGAIILILLGRAIYRKKKLSNVSQTKQ